jgi:hypothetical protein
VKPHPLTIEIERVVELGPVACGVSAIIKAGPVSLCSVVVTGAASTPEEARNFQNNVIEVIRQARGEPAPSVLDSAGVPVQPSDSQEVH